MAQVLVVDDDPTVLVYVALVLQLEGHRVRTESTYAAGLAALASQSYDCVVFDVRLDGHDGQTDGLGLVAFARRHGLLGSARVVLHTGEDWDAIARDAAHVGFCAYVPKPAAPESLARAVLGSNRLTRPAR